MTMDSLISGLMNGRSDACYINESIADYITNRNAGIESEVMPDQGKLRFMMGVNAEKPEMYERLNDALKALIADGTVASLTERWIDNFPADAEPDFRESLSIPVATETIVVGVTGDMPPIDYMAVDGTPSGFNVALLQKLGEKMGVNVKLVSLASEARIVALASGRIDVAFWINSVDAFQGNFIEGVLLTEPYASSDVCMLYTAGDRERILRAVDQVNTATDIMARIGVEEAYALAHADRAAVDAMISLIFEAPELALEIDETREARSWRLLAGDAVWACGNSASSGDTVESASTLIGGARVRAPKDGAASLAEALESAAFEAASFEKDGLTYALSAPISFGIGGEAAAELLPVFAYLQENGSIREQAADMLALLGARFEGAAYAAESDGARYIDANSTGDTGTRARFFGTQTQDGAAYTLLLGKGGADTRDADAFFAGVQNNAIEGMAVSITQSGGDTTIEGVSNLFGMLRAPSVRFAIRAQSGGETERYVFSAMGIDVLSVNVVRRAIEPLALPENGATADAGDLTNPELLSGVKLGLETLAETLKPLAPLTSKYLTGILG